MFRKMKLSLVGRVVLLSMAGTLIAILTLRTAVVRIFEESLDHQLENHLVSYTDLLVGAIKIQSDEVLVDANEPLLQAIPRHWQIDTKQEHIARSPLLKIWLPLSEGPIYKSQITSLTLDTGQRILAVRQAFDFPQGRKVIVTFGLEEEIAEQYKNLLRNQFGQSLEYVLWGSALILVLVGVLQMIFISRPLRRIKNSLEELEAGSRDRVEGKFPSEIQKISDNINSLLDYISGMLDRHRTFSSNMAHALKSPLTIVRNETDSPLVREQVESMLKIIDGNLARVQSSGSGNVLSRKTNVYATLQHIKTGLGKIHPVEINVDCPQDNFIRCEESDLYEILVNLMENSCKFGATRIKVSVEADEIVIEDDGPGIPEVQRTEVFRRGVRLDQTLPGSGIGLSIVQDIVNLYKGEFSLSESMWGGLKVRIIWKDVLS